MTDEEKAIMELYEQYMDDSALEEIREQEEREERLAEQKSGMKLTKKSNNDYKFDHEDSISICKFIRQYIGINVSDTSKITHAELKRQHNMFIKCVDNDYADQNPERVKKGELIKVIDSFGNRGTYINPDALKCFIEYLEKHPAMVEFKKRGIQSLSELDEYWSKCIFNQFTEETNDSFFKLLSETNNTDIINPIRRGMQLFDSIDQTVENKGGKKK